MRSISIIGPGRVGGALAIAFARVGFRIDALVYRGTPDLTAIIGHITHPPRTVSFDSLENVDSDVVIIATADADIPEVAANIAGKLLQDAVILHTSGALSSNELSVIAGDSRALGSMHPLVAVSDSIAGADSFAGANFCLEGDERAVEYAAQMVAALNGKSFTVDASCKALYHAGAVMAAGHFVALIDASISTLFACGIDRPQAKEILMPLVESALRNMKEQDLPKALTGPFARGDESTVARHVEAFERARLDDELNVYIELGLRSLDLAREQGVGAEKLDRIRDRIMMAKRRVK